MCHKLATLMILWQKWTIKPKLVNIMVECRQAKKMKLWKR